MVRQKIRDAEEARAALDAAARSGLPRATWARVHGVDARSLNAWRLNLERREPLDPVPLRLVELVAAPVAPTSRYVVRVGGWEVEVDDAFDARVLRRLLDVVATC